MRWKRRQNSYSNYKTHLFQYGFANTQNSHKNEAFIFAKKFLKINCDFFCFEK